MKSFIIYLIFFILITTSIEAKTYNLYIASTKYKEVSRKYIEEINDILQIENVIVRTHLKKNYSVIVRKIESIEEAKNLQGRLKNSTYKDSYIKEIKVVPNYSVLYETIKTQKNLTVVKESEKEIIKEDNYKHTVESSNEYITASTMFNIGDYKKAYTLFNKLFYKYNYNINVNYFLAQSAIKINKLDEASAALERILIQKPEFHKARYEYAKTLFKLKLKSEAKNQFNILMTEEIKQTTKNEIKKYLSALNKKRKYTYGSANILIGAGHSSNVNNGLLDHQYRVPSLDNIVLTGEKPKSDSFHNEAVSFTFNNIYRKDPKLRFQNSLFVYNKSYFNETQENSTVFGYKPNISYIYDNKVFSIESSLNRISRKNNESFNAIALTPNVRNNDFYTYLNIQKILYLSNENKEKNYKQIDLGYDYNLLKNLKISAKISKVTREKDLRTDIDRNHKKAGIEWFYKYDNKHMINLGYELDISNYKYENLLFNSKRKDENHFFNLAYTYTIDKDNRLVMSSSFTKNNSNQDAYIYEEIETKLNYLKQYKW